MDITDSDSDDGIHPYTGGKSRAAKYNEPEFNLNQSQEKSGLVNNELRRTGDGATFTRTVVHNETKAKKANKK